MPEELSPRDKLAEELNLKAEHAYAMCEELSPGDKLAEELNLKAQYAYAKYLAMKAVALDEQVATTAKEPDLSPAEREQYNDFRSDPSAAQAATHIDHSDLYAAATTVKLSQYRFPTRKEDTGWTW